MDKNNKNLIKEAIADLKAIREEANKSAKKRLAEEFKDKFEAYLIEETNKRKSMNESVNTDKNKDTKAQSPKKVNESVEDSIEEAFDDEIDMSDIQAELEKMEGMMMDNDNMVEDEMPEIDVEEGEAENTEDLNDPFTMIKKMHEIVSEMKDKMESKKIDETMKMEYDSHMKEMYGEGYKDMMGEEKVEEMYEMYKSARSGKKEKMDEMHKGNLGSDTINKMHNGDLGSKTIEEDMDEMNESVDPSVLASIGSLLAVVGGSGGAVALESYLKSKHPKAYEVLQKLGKGAAAGRKKFTASEGDMHEGDVNMEDIDEVHGIDHAKSKKVGAEKQPREGNDYRMKRLRYALQKENENKLKGLISENKKLMKENKALKVENKEVSELFESSQKTLHKYSKQLEEVATFNTNLAYVNNLLVNEDIALSQQDKADIIKKFRNIKDINESEKVYNNLLAKYNSDEKRTISESVEDKLTPKVIEGKADKELNESISPAKNYHLAKMIRNINYNYGK